METNMQVWQGRGRLEALVAELERQKESKLDVVMDASQVAVEAAAVGNDKWELRLSPVGSTAQEWLPSKGLPLNPNALVQIGDRVDPNVPSKFLRDLSAKRAEMAGELLTDLLHFTGGRHLIRSLDGKVRAFLSNKFRILDHYDAAFLALEKAKESGAKVIEAQLTDTKMRLKFVNLETFALVDNHTKGGQGGGHEWLNLPTDPNAPPGQVHPYSILSNSETGNGGLYFEEGLLTRLCSNTAIMGKAFRAIHLGGALEQGVYEEETIAADSRAIMLKARDLIAKSFTGASFKANVAIANKAAGDVIKAPSAAVGNLIENAGLSEDAKESILAHFLSDYSKTRYGLAQAVGRYAQDVSDPDQSHDLEALSGRVMAEPALVAA